MKNSAWSITPGNVATNVMSITVSSVAKYTGVDLLTLKQQLQGKASQQNSYSIVEECIRVTKVRHFNGSSQVLCIISRILATSEISALAALTEKSCHLLTMWYSGGKSKTLEAKRDLGSNLIFSSYQLREVTWMFFLCGTHIPMRLLKSSNFKNLESD